MQARKRFGQHFLSDPATVQAMLDILRPQPGQALVEIGPGRMALTRPLLERVPHLTVVEIDRDLAARLRRHQEALHVIENDALRVDFRALAQEMGAPAGKLRIVGNLPYNISTPLLFHLLDCADVIQDQLFMLQKEVVERMTAQPATAAYGRLSVVLQWRCAMQSVLHVPPQSFSPPPRVHSAVVHMRPHAQPAPLDMGVLQDLLRAAFSQRRKLLHHSLGPWLEARGFAGTFELRRRAEEVTVAEYEALAASFLAPVDIIKSGGEGEKHENRRAGITPTQAQMP